MKRPTQTKTKYDSQYINGMTYERPLETHLYVYLPLAVMEYIGYISSKHGGAAAWVYLYIYTQFHHHSNTAGTCVNIPVTYEEIKNASHGYGIDSIKNAVKVLIQHKYIKRPSKGTYCIPADTVEQQVSAINPIVKVHKLDPNYKPKKKGRPKRKRHNNG